MSDYSSYDEAIQAILDAQTDVDNKYKSIGNASSTLCDINQTMLQIPDGSVVRNRGGEVIGYDYKYTTPKLPDIGIITVDSNTDSGTFGEATGGGGHTSGGGAGRYRGSYYAGEVVDDQTSTDKMKGSGLVSGVVSAAWAAGSVLSKLGKTVASVTADVLEEVDAHFGVNFGPLNVDFGYGTADMANAVRALFGVDNQGNTTMYLEEDVIGALAIQTRDDGFFDSADEYIITDTTIPGAQINVTPPIVYRQTTLSTHISAYTIDGYERYVLYDPTVIGTDPNGNPLYWGIMDRYNISSLQGINVRYTLVSYNNVLYTCASSDRTTSRIVQLLSIYNNGSRTIVSNTVSVGLGSFSVSATYNNLTTYGTGMVASTSAYYSVIPQSADQASYNDGIVWLLRYGSASGGSTIPGVSDQDGAIIPVDAITGADPHVVAQNLESNYPQVMGTPVQIVVMDDSCNPVTKKYYSVPISYSPTNLNIGAPITGGLQLSPSFNPDVQLDLPDIDMDNYIDQIIKILGGSGAGRDVTVEPVPESDPDAPSDTIPDSGVNYDPPATGSGDTPEPVTPNMTPTDLWHVYACSPTNLSLFGQWLWGPAFDIDLFKRIFSNPMDAVIGVHALFAIPKTSSPSPIVCGNIASSVSAPVVTHQYTEVNCGSVWLTEYFGNVFDYEPFTEVSLFLPFIGVVDLSVSDVMRGRIAVKYTVDVFTGTCIAQVGVERDGSGGVLYQFSGSVAVGLPISGISYNTLFSSVLGMATSLAGAAASPTVAPGAIMSGVNSLLSYKDKVKRSGSFSGNAGAMGIKRPYLIISRPQPNTAEKFEHYQGIPSNNTVTVNSLSGFQRFESIHLSCPSAYGEELKEIESLLKAGVLI